MSNKKVSFQLLDPSEVVTIPLDDKGNFVEVLSVSSEATRVKYMRLITSIDTLNPDDFDSDNYKVDAWLAARGFVWSRLVNWKITLYKRDGSVSREVPFAYEEMESLPRALIIYIRDELYKLDADFSRRVTGTDDPN